MRDDLKTLLTLPSLLFFLFLALFPGLNPAAYAQSDLDGIKDLVVTRNQNVFLKAIYYSDKRVRFVEDSVMHTDGWRSTEHLAAIKRLREIDSMNTLKIDRYLDFHGYPEKDQFEEEAQIAPWLVLIHSQNQEIRKKHFNKLYEAYKDENLEIRRFLLFLEDEYQGVYHKDFQSYSQGSLRVEELIKELESDGQRKTPFKMP